MTKVTLTYYLTADGSKISEGSYISESQTGEEFALELDKMSKSNTLPGMPYDSQLTPTEIYGIVQAAGFGTGLMNWAPDLKRA